MGEHKSAVKPAAAKHAAPVASKPIVNPMDEKAEAKARIAELLASIKQPNNTSSMHLEAAEQIEKLLEKL